jgi:hypothetical protein
MRKVLAFAVVALLVAPVMASNYSDFDGTFESLAPGQLVGQDGWAMPGATGSNTNDVTQVTVVTDAITGMSGQKAMWTPKYNSAYNKVNSLLVNMLTLPTTGVIDFGFKMNMKNDGGTNPAELFFVGDSTFGGWNQYAAVKVTADKAEVTLGSSADFNFNFDQTYQINIVENLASKRISMYVDGVLAKTNVNASLTNPLAISLRSQNVTCYVDDITVTPEPATMSLLGLGVVGLLRRRSA